MATATQHTNPDPSYRGGALIDVKLPTREIVDGIAAQGTETVKVLKNVKIRYVNPVASMKTDPSRVYGYAFGQMKPGRYGSIGITGFDALAPVVAALKPGQVVSCIGNVNYREGKAFFEVQRMVQLGTPQTAEPVAAAPAKQAKPRTRRTTAAAAVAAPPAPAPAAPVDPDDEPSF